MTTITLTLTLEVDTEDFRNARDYDALAPCLAAALGVRGVLAASLTASSDQLTFLPPEINDALCRGAVADPAALAARTPRELRGRPGLSIHDVQGVSEALIRHRGLQLTPNGPIAD